MQALDIEKQAEKTPLNFQDIFAPGVRERLKAENLERINAITPENLHIEDIQVDEVDDGVC